jgi:hypothetical protein
MVLHKTMQHGSTCSFYSAKEHYYFQFNLIRQLRFAVKLQTCKKHATDSGTEEMVFCFLFE